MDEETEDIWECPECGQQLDLSGVGFYTEIACSSCGHREIVHTTLANYQLTGVLGVGGMSVVLKAVDPVLNRKVAIKVLNDVYRNQPERIERFERECALMAKVRHENVVGVYSAGWAHGQFYIAMELVEGQDLEYIVSHFGPIREAEALNMTRQVALGLRAAHRAGLLHRDMKPGNILVTPKGQAKVLDFGLSLAQRDEDTEQVIWATPYYVAPETIFREAEDVRTDIYALGMTLRFLLTGEEEFSDRPPSSIEELAEYKRRLPSLRVGHHYLSDSLCDLADHMTEFDPDSRPLSYDSLLREIDDVMTDLRTGDALDTPEGRRRFRRRLLLGSAATLGAGAVAAAITAALSTPEPEQLVVHPQAPLYWPMYDTAASKLRLLQAQGCSPKVQEEYIWMMTADGTEPRFHAWVGLQALAICVLRRDAEKLAEVRSQLREWLHHIKLDEEKGERMNLALKQVSWVTEGDIKAMKSYAPDGSAPTLALLCIAGYRYHQDMAHPALAEQFLELARDCAKQCADRYPGLAEAIESFAAAEKAAPAAKPPAKPEPPRAKPAPPPPGRSDAAPNKPDSAASSSADRDASPGQRAVERLKSLQKGCDVEQIAQALSDIRADRNLPLTAAERDRYVLMHEVCEVLTAAFAAAEGAGRHLTTPGMTPERIRDAASGLRDHFDAEIYTMLLLLQGRVDEAERANPYAADTNSQEPFAVFMRDWLFRARRL